MNYLTKFFTISQSAINAEGDIYSFGFGKGGGSDEK